MVEAYFEVISLQLRGEAEIITSDESLYVTSNDNGATVVNFATYLSKVQRSHILTFVRLLGHLLMEKRTTKFTTY